MRADRAKRGNRMFEREELLAALAHAGVAIKAMILLGVNCGLGNTDCALLPITAVDLKRGWLDYPRPKTAIARRVPLWPETIEALKAALAQRPEPKDQADAPLLFIGPRGVSYAAGHSGVRVHAEIRDCLKAAKITRKGLSFYALRHTFSTIAEGARDLPARASDHGPRCRHHRYGRGLPGAS